MRKPRCPPGQLLTYLQEAVSLDSELNRLRLDQMLRMSQGKTIMVCSQYLDALDNIAALVDKASPRKGAPIEGGGKGSGGGRHVNWSEFGASSDGDDDSNGSISVDGFTKMKWYITWSTRWVSRSNSDSSAVRNGPSSQQNAVNT